MESKQCSRCGIDKSLTEFAVRKDRPCGIKAECKRCLAKRSAAYTATHFDQRIEYRRRRAEAFPNEAAEKGRAFRKTNSKAVAEALKKRKAEHPEWNPAHMAVKAAIKAGTLIPQPCFCCGKESTQAHHSSYDKGMYLVVTWLCRAHHMRLHAEAAKYVQHKP